MKNRLNIVFLIIVSILTILLFRIYFLSIKSNTYYEELSKNNYINRVYKVPIRGIIEDRNGKKLAVNEIGFSIFLKPHLSSSKNKKVLNNIVDLIVKNFPNLKKEKILKQYKRNDSVYNHNFIKIVDYIPYQEFFTKYTTFASKEEIKIESATKRFYPYKNIASHIIGYVGKASKIDITNDELAAHSGIVGKNGLEKFYNKKLQGSIGYKDIKVNALNEELEEIDNKEPSIDNNIKISLDIELQRYIQEVFNKKSGAVVVMNAKDGEILAAASFPEYNNNIFARGISVKQWNKMRNDFNHPFTNRIVNGLYPPGSIIKMGVALSFLQNGISEDFIINDIGYIKVGNRKFRDWKRWGHGLTGFTKAIVESCDTFFYDGSLRIGINKISKTLGQLGFGKKTGIDQVNEFVGVNPNKEWKQKKYNQPWYIGETVITAIGQGNMLVTPIQMARYTAFLATGKLPKPYLYKANYEEPKDLHIPKRYLDIVRRGMYGVTHSIKGTATKHIDTDISIAGKTGTAQVVSIPQSEKVRMKESELKYYQRSHAWLTTYGPYKNPQYVVTILVEHGGHGGQVGKLVSKIYDKLYEMGYITSKK